MWAWVLLTLFIGFLTGAAFMIWVLRNLVMASPTSQIDDVFNQAEQQMYQRARGR